MISYLRNHSAIVSWGFLVLIWETFYLLINNRLIVPSPIDTFATFGNLFFKESFRGYVYASLYDLTTGWIMGISLMFLISLVMLISETFLRFMRDLASGWQAAPTFAVAPIVLTIFGYSRTSALVMMVWGTIWYGIIHLSADVHEAKTRWQKQAHNLKWNYFTQWYKIYMPAMLPRFLIICKITWAMMWRVLIAVEVLFGSISGHYGLGSWMMETKIDYLVEETWSILIVILVFGVAVNKFFDWARSKIDWY